MPPQSRPAANTKKALVPTTYIALVAHFLDFLAAAIHTILYERAVYPRSSFAAVRKYNYPVRHSRVPEVREWINATIDAIEEELLRPRGEGGAVERVTLVIYSRYMDPLERFVFDLSRFPAVARRDWHVPFASTAPEAVAERARAHKQVPVVDMEQQFRAVMARLQFMQRELEPLPDEVSWTVALEVREGAEAPGPIESKFSEWIAVEPSLQKERVRDDKTAARVGSEVGGVRTTPVRAVEAGEMAFEVWVEEGACKIDALDRERFSDEYEEAEDVPGLYTEPKAEAEPETGKSKTTSRDKGKGKARAETESEDEAAAARGEGGMRDDADEFDGVEDDLEDMSQYSFLARKR